MAQDGVYETRSGIGMPLGAPATILPCKDGHVWMIALEPGQWHGLRRAMGDPEWARIDLFPGDLEPDGELIVQVNRYIDAKSIADGLPGSGLRPKELLSSRMNIWRIISCPASSCS